MPQVGLPQAQNEDYHKRSKELIDGYREGSDTLLNCQEYEFIVDAMASDIVNHQQHFRLTQDLVIGEFEHAAKGLFKLINVPEKEVFRQAQAGVAAIVEEVMALGDDNVSENLDYILHKEAEEKVLQYGIRDKGHAGMSLEDFVNHEYARAAELEEAEVVALRLFTTSAFLHISLPLRDQERISSGKPHPLPVTVMMIAQGIKKLRSANLFNAKDSVKSMVLWRGMKNVRPTDLFAEEGGTEVMCIFLCL